MEDNWNNLDFRNLEMDGKWQTSGVLDYIPQKWS